MLQQQHLLGEFVWRNEIVAIQKQQVITRSVVNSEIPSCRYSASALVMVFNAFIVTGKPFGHSFGIVTGAVVDNECFPMGMRLRLQGTDSLWQAKSIIENRYNYRN